MHAYIQSFNFHCLNSHSSSLLACFPSIPFIYILFMAILWCSSSSPSPSPSKSNTTSQTHEENPFTENPFAAFPKTCPTCGHQLDHCQEQTGGGGGVGIQELPGLPAGVKFDPTDQELLEHLEGKVRFDIRNHPRIDEFIHTIEGENGICYTHPEKLPGVNKDGLIRHFFHRPAKAYPTGTRKRRKVHTDDEDGSETRWHKTGKTRPVIVDGEVKGYKKILVLYINYRKLKKSEKTNWVMHQYHLGNNEEEKDGELVVSKVFYQTQPRHTAPSSSGVNKDSLLIPSNLEGGQGVASPLPISVDWSYRDDWTSRDRGNPSHRALITFRH